MRAKLKSTQEELAAFFAAELPIITGYLTKRAGSRSDAEDLAQEAWIRLARNADRAGHAPRPYLQRILRSVVADFWRKRDRRHMARHVDVPWDFPADTPTPEDTVAAKSDLATLEAALEELPKRRRDIFIRANLHSQSCQEIARLYGVSRRTVEMEVKSALDHCAERLDR